MVMIAALAASLGAHVLALFVPDIDWSVLPEPPALTAELQPLPKAVLPGGAIQKLQRKLPLAKRSRPPAHSRPPANAMPALSLPEPSEAADLDAPTALNAPTEPDSAQAPLATNLPPAELHAKSPAETYAESRMPAHGTIRYRVDRGEQGFELGRSIHEWALADGRYRITSVTETSGLAALLKPLRVELESRGRLTPEGLQPEYFAIRRDGKPGREQADFDWAQMQVRIGGAGDSNAVTHRLLPGTQDLLSFNYQLGFLAHPEADNNLPIATGKKYTTYPLQTLGDEEIEIPAGVFRTLHLRAPGDNTTELWLAYDYWLLPVKIRHLDRHGDSFIQVATEIKLSKEPSPQ